MSVFWSGVDWVWNVIAHAQKPDFVFRRNGRVHLNRQGRRFNRLLAGEMCVSAVVMLDTPCSEVVWGVLVIHSIRQFRLHFPSRASPCAITFQLDSTDFYVTPPEPFPSSWFCSYTVSNSKVVEAPTCKVGDTSNTECKTIKWCVVFGVCGSVYLQILK
jgi:hypothetical protein